MSTKLRSCVQESKGLGSQDCTDANVGRMGWYGLDRSGSG
jgi:hypothetical protein